jgi:chorismate-pyruvate lyase
MPAMNRVHALLSILPGLVIGVTASNELSAAASVDGLTWPNTFVARVEALALLQTLNANLLSHDSATRILERWCDVHQLATPAQILAVRLRVAPKPPTDAQRRSLRVGPTDIVRYRHVQLVCGSLVLSRAENWYVPSRLSPEMNRLLETTDAPFGTIVQSLHFQRHTLAARLLWSPLPAAWEMANQPTKPETPWLLVPPDVLEHRALLTLHDGTPFSEVVETYSGNVLAFAAPPGATAPARP